MNAGIEKVTAFVTRMVNGRRELLLFEHPYAGIQIPAGTVEPGEAPEAAAIRETHEETGLRDVAIDQYLDVREVVLPDTQRMIIAPTGVYARPDRMSFNWIQVGRGLTVTVERQSGDFTHISYQEWDRQADPAYVSYPMSGWVPSDVLAQVHGRHFFTLTATDAGALADYCRAGAALHALLDTAGRASTAPVFAGLLARRVHDEPGSAGKRPATKLSMILCSSSCLTDERSLPQRARISVLR